MRRLCEDVARRYAPESSFATAQTNGDAATENDLPERLPVELLPVAVRDFAHDVATRMQCPLEFVAASIIVGAASIIGNRIRVAPKQKDDWTVTPNLWGAIVATPGKLKTPALMSGLEPVKQRERLARDDYREQAKEFEFLRLEREAQREAVKAKVKEAARKGEPTATFQTEFERFAELDQPTAKNYIVNDATVEKLGVLLNRNPRGLLLFRDELIGFLRSLDKEENASARAFFLECWNGYGEYTFDRIGRGDTRIENLTLSILGGIQPGVLSGYLRGAIAGGEFDDGLMQRLQIAFYPDATAWQLVDRAPDATATALAFQCFARLDELDTGKTADGNDKPLILRFDAAAQKLFYEWWTELEKSFEAGEVEHSALIAHFAKYRSLMPSLALIFHLFDVVGNNEQINEQTAISFDAAETTAAWCELLAAHARRIYGIATRPETSRAKTVLQKIRSGKLKPQFTARDIYQKGWAGLQSSDDCARPLQLLVDYGYLHVLPSPPNADGGRPTKTYLAHSSLLTGDTESDK